MKIPVLSYHSINNDKSKLSLDINIFEKQIKYLKKRGFVTCKTNLINNKKKQIIITFDDGYKDILLNAMPVLKKYDFTATCFLITNMIGKKNFWDSGKKNYISKELMTEDDIKFWLSNGMSIGSHSHNHYDLTKLKLDNLNEELLISKKILEDKFGQKIDNFCYPYGKVNKIVFEKTKNIFIKAFTTNRARFDTDNHNFCLIPRIDMGKDISFFKIFLKLETIYEDIKFKKNELYL